MGRMISARRGAGVTNLNDKIYAVGGYDGKSMPDSSYIPMVSRTGGAL